MIMKIFWKICRVCLKYSENMISVFTEEDNCLLSEKISKCGDIEIFDENQNYPDKICPQCIAYLNIAYKFRTTCKDSDSLLKQLLSKGLGSNLENLSPPFEKEFNTKNSLSTSKLNKKKDKYVEKYSSFTIFEVTSDNGEIVLQVNTDDKLDKINSEVEVNPSEGNCMDIEHLDNINSEDENFLIYEEENINNEIIKKFSYIFESDNDGYNIIKDKPNHYYIDVKNDNIILVTNKLLVDNENEIQQDDPEEVYEITCKNDGKNFEKPTKRKKELSKDVLLSKNVEINPTSNNDFICEVCGKKYKNKILLNCHKLWHSTEKNYKCKTCDREFITNFQLKRHIRVHTGDKPYECKICEKKFSDYTTYKKHERSHTNERPFQCEICSKSFNYAHVLKIHMSVHTKEKPYVCTQCDKKFSRPHHLKNHLASNSHQNDKKRKNKTKLLSVKS